METLHQYLVLAPVSKLFLWEQAFVWMIIAELCPGKKQFSNSGYRHTPTPQSRSRTCHRIPHALFQAYMLGTKLTTLSAAESSGKSQEAHHSDTLIWRPGLAYTISNEKHRRRVDASVLARRSFRSFLFPARTAS